MKLLLVITLVFLTFKVQSQSKVVIQLEGIKYPKGKILVNLFNQNAGFPSRNQQAFKAAVVNVSSANNIFITFDNLPHGNYAISLFHDENENNAIDKNFLGIPVEGYAFSNNYKPLVKSPTFKDAMFEVREDTKKLYLKLIY